MKTPLTPLEPVLRALRVYPSRPALIEADGGGHLSYEGLADRTARLVTLLREEGLTPGGHVLLLSPNTADALTAFHAVPLAGGVIVPLNPRFRDAELTFLSAHADPVLALVDAAHLPRVAATLAERGVPVIVTGSQGTLAQRLARVPPAPLTLPDPLAENDPISVNYTSGTTSDPKGVMLTHRGVFLSVTNMLYHLNLRPGSVFLHALPFAHANGWGSVWAVTAAGGTHVMLPDPSPAQLRGAITAHGVTHLCASPALLAPLADTAAPLPLPHPVRVMLAGTSPPPRLITALQTQGFEVLHGYGLTESSALVTLADPTPETQALAPEEQVRLLARQGYTMLLAGQVAVVRDDGTPVPHDGATPGEIVLRGNQIMKGYYKNRAATRRAVRDGWLHTGDVACVHPDGRLEILDRAGDLLNVAGQPVSSAQVEAVLYRHPSVREAVVVAARGEDGDVPVAFVTLHPGAQVQGRELLSFARPHLPPHALPARIVFTPELPKTASGKVLKYVLREQARERVAGQPAD
ncbi:AMP-binding protein [Deinococcus sp. YIM 77859]|uniref:AMP-binding protein n=1 Tax=Deinococcus sp. YIM 77859 TaxID=1540221 RepID=UPI0005551224|nr:AMP-binding protein [Deinococcus sp. YIM 77859]